MDTATAPSTSPPAWPMPGARVCTAPSPPGRPPTPEWARSAILDVKGVVYAPAVVIGPGLEAEVEERAREEGIPVATSFGGHAYLPVQWLATAYPDKAATLAKIDHVVRRHCAAETN